MAKRKRMTAPDAEALKELETGFAAKHTEGKSLVPPIAQVAGEAAALSASESVVDRVEAAKDRLDADAYRKASDAGLVAHQVPLVDVDADFIRRDRISENEEHMQELMVSLRNHGMRTPIDVVRTKDGYGLIAGYRRLKALRRLAQEDGGITTIPAFIREGKSRADSYVNMVEENEIRSNLTPYERGRIAVLAVGQGVFDTIEDAVDVLFAAASRAKRSKVRSFATVHEAVGDLLRFPTELSERNGLKLANAIRDGRQSELRDALDGENVSNAKAEWALLDATLGRGQTTPDVARGGRPKQNFNGPSIKLDNGGTIRATTTKTGFSIEVEGATLSDDELNEILGVIYLEIKRS